jgi:type IV secretory pathway VirB2 component (pilin)
MMMDGMMGGGMMWFMGLAGILVLVVLLLAAAALVKYLLSGRGPGTRSADARGHGEAPRDR